MATPIRIVGIGSPHGGDQAGWDYVEALRISGLQEHFPEGTVSIHQSPTPIHLFELLTGCQHAIIIDAIQGKTGQITCLDLDDLDSQSNRYSVHGIGVAEALALLNTLMNPAPQTTIIAIGIDTIHGESTQTDIRQPTVNELGELVKQRIRHSLDAPRVTDVS